MADVIGGGHHLDLKKLSYVGVLVSLGIVFGDIGTSPLYVMKAIVNARQVGATMPFDEYIEGALSCIIWTLTLQTTLKYVIIALRADNKGEGGILALFSLIKKSEKTMALPHCYYWSIGFGCRWGHYSVTYCNVSN